MCKRVLVKISGEALKSSREALSEKKLDYITEVIKDLYHKDYEVAVIVGAGNISRGTFGEKWGISPADADVNGMLATIVNAGWMTSILEKKIDKKSVRKMITIPSSYVGEAYSMEKAKSYLNKGKIVVIGGGNGVSLCTTDSAAIQRAIELDVDLVLMLKNGADGVYTEDPRKNPKARKYKSISFEDFEKMGAGVIDRVASVNAARYKVPLHFISFGEAKKIAAICNGKTNIGTCVGDCTTELYATVSST